MNCLRCQKPIDLGGKTCAACGAPIDADGDGVPDVLAKMVEDKARSLLAAERAAAEAEVVRKGVEARVEQERLALTEQRQALVRARDRLEQNELAPRRFWIMRSWIVLLTGAIALVVGGAIFPGCVEPISGRSVVAASLLCSSSCEGCRGPGRVFTWHESSGSYEGNVSTQLCHNDKVNIDALKWMDVTGNEEKELKPYVLSLWWSVPLDAGIVFLVLIAFFPFVAARFRNKYLHSEGTRLRAEIHQLERTIAKAEPASPNAGAYRS